jgi:DNA-directed RNA polymerase delta subunit
MRRAADMGPATINEIFDSLVEGAYEVGAKNTQIAKVSLYNSLGKNPSFYKLPNKQWGLRAWYPNAEVESGGNDRPKKSPRKKTKKSEKISKTESVPEPAVQATQPVPKAAPTNGGEFSASMLEDFVRAKNRRIKDVAAHFYVTKSKVKKLFEPNSKVYLAEKGWLKVRE